MEMSRFEVVTARSNSSSRFEKSEPQDDIEESKTFSVKKMGKSSKKKKKKKKSAPLNRKNTSQIRQNNKTVQNPHEVSASCNVPPIRCNPASSIDHSVRPARLGVNGVRQLYHSAVGPLSQGNHYESVIKEENTGVPRNRNYAISEEECKHNFSTPISGIESQEEDPNAPDSQADLSAFNDSSWLPRG